jgi:ribose/xylose/arabinose/galactoside ABC-type transport system permease subunit
MATNIKEYRTKVLSLQKAFLAILIVVLVMALFNLTEKTKTEFFSSYNFIDLLKSNSIYLILGMGETIVLIAGGVDLSIGGVMTVAGILSILAINAGVPMPIAVILCVLFGAVIGAINAYISVYQKTEPFIITLGMGILLTGVAQQLTNAHPISVDFSYSESYLNLANYQLFGFLPVLVIVMLVVVFTMNWILRSTSFGRNCYAIGGDYEVAKYSGINVLRNKSWPYVISGVTAAIGGVMLSSQLNAGNSIFGDLTALYVVCAVVVGGTSVAGGIGGAIKSAIGLILLGILSNAFNMLRIDSYVPYLPQALQGLIIVGIIWLDCYGRKRKREEV